MDGAHTVHEGDSTPRKVMDRKSCTNRLPEIIKLDLKKKKDESVDRIHLLQDSDKCL